MTRRRVVAAAVCGALLLTAGCADKPAVRKSAAKLGEPQACEALLERPADHELAVASVVTGEDGDKARGLAEAQAFTALQQRLCRGWRCDELAEGIRVVDAREHEGQSCALAGVSASFVTAWLKPAREEMSAGLAEEARRIAAALRATEAPGSAKPRALVAPLVDHGVEGGQRARWLRLQMIEALKGAGVAVDAAPDTWRGLHIPDGKHGVVRAAIRPGRSRAERFEVVWTVDTLKGRAQGQAQEIVRALADDVAPETARKELLVSAPGKLGARLIGGDEGGGLCAGQQAALWVELPAAMQVRVFVVYGQEQAAQIYPKTSADAATLPAGAHELVKVGGHGLGGADVVRFVVVGASDEEGLGRMKTLKAACALPADSARKLHEGGGVAPTAIETTTSAGFRLMDAASCEDTGAAKDTGLEWVKDLPTCWEKP